MKLRIEEKQRCAVDEITQSHRQASAERTSRQLDGWTDARAASWTDGPTLGCSDRVEVLPLILILLLVLLSRHRLNSFKGDVAMFPPQASDGECPVRVSRVCPGSPRCLFTLSRLPPGRGFEPVFLRCATTVREKKRVHESRREAHRRSRAASSCLMCIGRSEVPTRSDRPSQSHHTVSEFPHSVTGACVTV